MRWLSLYRTHILLASALALAVFGTYAPSLRNGFVGLDDRLLATENPIVIHPSLRSVAKAFTSYDPELYIPVTILSYQAEFLLFGNSPFFHHLTSLFLHVGSTLLVFLFVLLLLKDNPRRASVAFFAALLFGVHPLNAEAVSWVSGRKDLLAGFFSLASLVSYLRAKSGSFRGRVLSLLFFFLALLSKVSAAPLPLLLLLIDRRQDGKIGWGRIKDKWLYIVFSALFVLIAIAGKATVIAKLTLGGSILLALKSIVFLLQKIVLPRDLAFLYQYPHTPSLLSPDFYIPLLILLLLAGLIAIFRKRGDVLFGSAFFVICLLPSFVTFTKKGAIILASDRYAYLAMIGVLLVILRLLFALTERHRLKFVGMTTVLCVIALVLASLTVRQSGVWFSYETLVRQNALAQPESPYARLEYGSLLFEQGRYDESMEELKIAVKLDPESPLANADLGAAYGRKGMYREGLPYLLKSLQLRGAEVPPDVRKMMEDFRKAEEAKAK